MDEREISEIISKNLKKLLSDNNMEQKALAKIAGVSESAAGKWILGKSTPRMGAIQKISDHFGIPKSYILNENPSNLESVTPRTMRIPVLGKIACGDPILAQENIEEYIYRSPDNIPKGTLFALVAKGDSMEPTIPDGAYVIIREQSDCESGDIVAVLVNGDSEATLKRLKRQGDTIMLLPENPRYEPYIVDHAHNARIIGKAISYEKRI